MARAGREQGTKVTTLKRLEMKHLLMGIQTRRSISGHRFLAMPTGKGLKQRHKRRENTENTESATAVLLLVVPEGAP